MENKNQNPEMGTESIGVTEIQTKKPYWNGKMSDLPIVQEMIRADNSTFQIGPNKYVEAD